MIQEAIGVFQRKNESFKLASKELNVEEPVSLTPVVLGELGS